MTQEDKDRIFRLKELRALLDLEHKRQCTGKECKTFMFFDTFYFCDAKYKGYKYWCADWDCKYENILKRIND